MCIPEKKVVVYIIHTYARRQCHWYDGTTLDKHWNFIQSEGSFNNLVPVNKLSTRP